jgi:hypothetical protein
MAGRRGYGDQVIAIHRLQNDGDRVVRQAVAAVRPRIDPCSGGWLGRRELSPMPDR